MKISSFLSLFSLNNQTNEYFSHCDVDYRPPKKRHANDQSIPCRILLVNRRQKYFYPH